MTSITAFDHGAELKLRRDGFVERLYAPPPRKDIIFLSGMVSKGRLVLEGRFVSEAEMVSEPVAVMMADSALWRSH